MEIKCDLQQPFNDAVEDGVTLDGCGLYTRYYNFGAYVDFCGLSVNPEDFENVQTLYVKTLKETNENSNKITELENSMNEISDKVETNKNDITVINEQIEEIKKELEETV